MNILYISPMLIDNDNLDGVARKMLYQCHALGSVGENDMIYLASFFAENYYAVKGDYYEKQIQFVNKKSKQLNMFQIYPKIPDICRELQIDAVYFRVMALSWITDNLFKVLKKQHIRIVIEIPTYPFWKEKWMDVARNIRTGKIGIGLKRSLTNLVYWHYAYRLKNGIKAIVTFSNIKELWGNKVIGIANGYHFEIPESGTLLKKADEPINLLLVASVRDNHGADRIINGLAKYYESAREREIYFHIVGNGDAIPSLKELVKSYPRLERKIIFHGFKSGEQLEKMYRLADIGVSAMAFHRLGVTYCSPLKSKEYFAKGLPIIGTTAEKDIITTECKKYFFETSEDDTPVDIEKVLEFYDNLKNNQTTDKDIIEMAAKYFDWQNIMKPIYRVLANA